MVPAYCLSLGVSYAVLQVFSSLKLPALAVASLPPRSLLRLSTAVLLSGVGLYVIFGGLADFNLNLERVYEFRAESADRLPVIFGYFYSNLASAVIPLSVILALMLKSRVAALFVVALSIMLFGLTHHKSVFFAPFIAVIFFWFFRSESPITKVGVFFSLLCAISIVEILIIGQIAEGEIPPIYSSYFIRRSLLVPALADRAYVEFFANNPYLFWSQSKLTFGLVNSPYESTVPFLIGREYFGDAELAANAGFIGSGYANAGIIGVLFYGLIVGLVIGSINAFGRRIGHGVVASVCLLPVMTMVTSTDVLTAVLSHGVLLLLIFLSVAGKAKLASY
jgi:hypothetical protein